ncbi:huntingtin-interacting protein K isoform X1 [Diceros bicornis minor]|uniref:huntingtin-interacting protein K isoform X1 n=1 Tax=Diceros bicornis minor TaxID=77932 RepID=UPI0026EEEF16|nr:huntingtin-interacting protein K isoform X1 [Diceros bicornis minor]
MDMATEGDVELELETETSGPERPPEKPRKHDSGAADLERVTDYAEEKEIQSSNLETAMSVIGDRRSREQKAKQERCKVYNSTLLLVERKASWQRLLPAVKTPGEGMGMLGKRNWQKSPSRKKIWS